MPRVFTITPGLENLGALKTGGQGSVYKGRRIGEIITAIKILPTPVYSESADDKNYVSFTNEVAKLKRVNETPNPNVVKILSSGLTESGGLPFIEMEFIEGPDLEELLKPPHDPVFTIKETSKVAEHLSNALAHCHRLDVKHGDIKSNNVKFNKSSGNYVLLDFGLAVMSDEQRRSSLHQAGAIEFMAPEQNTGKMLFQTDVYSFGVVLYELLAGVVPFPLKERGESARNEVRLAHMVSPVPDLLQCREDNLPGSWDPEKRQAEMQVPEWLLKMVYKCLEKKPELRFSDGEALHTFVSGKLVSAAEVAKSPEVVMDLQRENLKLIDRQEQLQNQVWQVRSEADQKEETIRQLKEQLREQQQHIGELQSKPTRRERGVPAAAFYAVVLICLALAAYSISGFLAADSAEPNPVNKNATVVADTTVKTEPATGKTAANTPQQKVVKVNKDATIKTEKQAATTRQQNNPPQKDKEQNKTDLPSNTGSTTPTAPPDRTITEGAGSNKIVKRYLIVSKAYFYSQPDANSREDMFINASDEAIVNALDERYGYILVSITTPQGRSIKGWLPKSSLKLYGIE